MSNQDRAKYYTIYHPMTGYSTNAVCVAEAAKTFFQANAAERPVVLYGNHRSCRKIAGAMIIGDQFLKWLPFETDPAFTQAYLSLRAQP